MIKAFYFEKNTLKILDQRLLPAKIFYIRCKTHGDVYMCIRNMAVRGAPAIGVCASFGMLLACSEKKIKNIAAMKKNLFSAGKYLVSARPTAVNLFWAVNRIEELIKKYRGGNTSELKFLIQKEAHNMYEEDVSANKTMGGYGASLFKKNSVVLTHCNTGALATAGWGTALGVIRSAYLQGKIKNVYVDETRPYLQGARITAFELFREKIPCVLITDNMAGYFMSTGGIDAVIVGADRIAPNGDVANKIGTYSLAVLCKHHKIPFYIAAPVSTIDSKIKNGKGIKIEFRSSKEVVTVLGKDIAPRGVKALHPAFDITPGNMITAIITEKGIIYPPYKRRVKEFENRSTPFV